MDHLLVMPLTPFEIAMSKVWANGLVITVAVGLSLYIVVRTVLGVPIADSIPLFMIGVAIYLHPDLWAYLAPLVERYDAVVLSLLEYAQNLATPQRFIMPAAPNLCCAINFEGSCRRRAIPTPMDRGGSETDTITDSSPTGRVPAAGASAGSTIIQHNPPRTGKGKDGASAW